MSEKPIVMYGTDWCLDCVRSKNFLQKQSVPFTWVNIDKDKEGERYIREVNGGNRSVPTIVFQDGSILVEPSNKELGEKLGIGAA
jgi:glutaredoxin-like protein